MSAIRDVRRGWSLRDLGIRVRRLRVQGLAT